MGFHRALVPFVALALLAAAPAIGPAGPAVTNGAGEAVQIPPAPPPLDFPLPTLLPAGKDFPVTDFGAVADGTTINTAAIQKAIDACSAAGGGTVVIPKAGTGVFLSGAIFLKKGTNLRVEKDAMLKGSPFPADYPIIDTRFEGIERPFMAGFVNATGLTGITIGGQGTIDGNFEGYSANTGRGGGARGGRGGGGGRGAATAPAASNPANPATTTTRGAGARFPAPPLVNNFTGPRTVLTPTPDNPPANTLVGAGGNRPRLMILTNCSNVAVRDLRLQNQCVWCLHILYSTDVLAENLNIYGRAPSSDGMDIDSSRRVRVSKCTIDANDDCISIKSGKDADGRRVNKACEDILVVDSHMAFGHGGVAMGSEVSGTIRNVEVRDTLMDAGNLAPIRFKSQPTRGGTVENIVYRNVKLDNTRQAFEFNLEWTATAGSGSRQPTTVKNVYILNVSGTCQSAGRIHGLPDSLITNIVFQDCNITSNTGLVLDNTKNLDTRGLHITAAQGEPIINRGTQTTITPFVPRGGQGAATAPATGPAAP